MRCPSSLYIYIVVAEAVWETISLMLFTPKETLKYKKEGKRGIQCVREI